MLNTGAHVGTYSLSQDAVNVGRLTLIVSIVFMHKCTQMHVPALVIVYHVMWRQLNIVNRSLKIQMISLYELIVFYKKKL